MSGVYARRRSPRRLAALAAVTGCVSVAALLTGGTAEASPPDPVSAETARTYLGELTEQAEGSSDGYDREKFPHWSTQEGACNTREVVLERDGTDVEQDDSCAATAGSWFSEYDGETWSASGDVDIDHVVPLAEAWRSGASSWTDDAREGFANDLTRPQLIAVTDNVNQSKGDKDPADWLPPLASYNCVYARMWVEVKHHYELTVDPAEKTALEGVLKGC
ncbi:hypothetical protein DSC45_14475 [Streptomyces sp. YIM 130001]|uniref:HNH endonuclease family protein n=1 Tax=Streptomyces sp. YIM 130001 TaxID=2259644 RepID=UPI000E65E980|nr:HNH endonuclease family protein [Streptomyces sp. YIM 130001]RII16965.1 hypothetical protein DSC45_14475 [Streptomyces sp. YIM 130001]